MKTLSFLLIPTILLIVLCIIFGMKWYWYIAAFSVGNGIGVLITYIWFQVRDNSGKPKVKIEKDE